MKRFLSLMFSLALLGSMSFAQRPQMSQFSSDYSVKNPKKADGNMTGKFYMGGQKIRFDGNSHGHSVEMIIDNSAKKMYMVMNEQKMYMEQAIDPNAPHRGPQFDVPKDPDHPCDPDHYTCEKVGSEMMNGRMCDKWVTKAKDEGNEAENETKWVDKKLGMPIRSVKGDGTEMNMTNVQEGPQDASLFVVPAGYQSMGSFGGMMMPPGRKPKN